MRTTDSDIIIRVKNLKKYYPVKRGLLYRTADWIKAVDDVTLSITRGRTLGLVGESGCGKTTLGRTIIRLLKPESGEIYFKGEEISKTVQSRLRPLRQYMQIVFQDPFSSLDPRYPVGRSVSEGLSVFKRLKRREVMARLQNLFQTVGLPAESINRYPHEFSGGQRQRIGIARALAPDPEFIILDEPISSLDI